MEVERAEAWGTVGLIGPPTGEVPALALNGHLDVVPAGDAFLWADNDPFTVRERDGRWYGRGVCDMLGGSRRSSVRPVRCVPPAHARAALAVHAVVGEEDGGLGTYATLRRGHPPTPA